jgi:regulator of protease activity HflC (stomatin/prohibitin superfamily)
MFKFLLVLSTVAFTLTGCGIKVVETGNRGVKVRFGEILGEPLPEGLYFYNPITTSIKELNVREVKHTATTNVYSKDAQVVEVTYTLNFKPMASEIAELYKNVGYNWSEVLIRQILEGNIKEVSGKYAAVDLIEKRQEFGNQIITELTAEFAKKRIELISFEVSDMNFDDDFETAVKNKVIAVEQAKEAQNRTVKIREEADQQIIAAKAEAESMRIRSNALKENKGLVDYEAVQKWDGKLPQQMFGNSMPFVNIKQK